MSSNQTYSLFAPEGGCVSRLTVGGVSLKLCMKTSCISFLECVIINPPAFCLYFWITSADVQKLGHKTTQIISKQLFERSRKACLFILNP